MAESVISIDRLGKRYRLLPDVRENLNPESFKMSRVRRLLGRRVPFRHGEEFWALRDVSMEISRGEIIGIIGANGAGKSTLLKILAEITEPTEGRAVIRGRVGSLLEVGTGFQADLSGRDNIYLNGGILGMKRSEIESKYDDIVDFAGIGRFIDIPVKWYSSGMYVRLAFAVAAHLEPEILLVDEVLAVGDLAFQRKCLGRIDEIANSGRTILFVSHNLASVASLCTTAFLLEGGRVTDRGDVSRIIQRYVASSREEMTTSTADRTDRRGTGTLHFTAAEVGTANAVMMGEEVEIRLSYTAPAPIRDVMVGIAAYGALGEALFVCSTRIAGNEVASAPSMGTFACTVPRFPLLPGTYYLNVYAEVQGEVADWLENACAFEVFESDFFGSGQLPPTTHGHFAVDHSWSVVDAAVEEAVG